MVSNKLYNEPIKKELKGFLILLKSLTLNGTNFILYSYSELENKMNYSKRQIGTYIRALIELGYLEKCNKGYFITRDDLFIILGSKEETYMKQIEHTISLPNIMLPKSYKQYIEAKKNNFKGITNMESFLFYVISGVPFKSKKKDKNEKSFIIL